MKDCIAAMITRFLFDNVVTRLSFPKILMSDKGDHFINQMFRQMIEELQIQHKKSTLYHPQANGIAEAFNKVLENALTKICNTNCDDWDLKIPTILWDYMTTC